MQQLTHPFSKGLSKMFPQNNLKEDSLLAATSVRQRLAQHRADPACAACHDLMDPIGFALKNYDAVGRWRDYEVETEVDSSGALPDGKESSDVSQLEKGILKGPHEPVYWIV